MRDLKQLLEGLDYKRMQGNVQMRITELVYDSRKASPGCLFVCLKGAVSDGHSFLPEVIGAGAAAVVVSEDVLAPEGVTVIRTKDTRYALAVLSAAYFDHPAKKLKVIGITGTKGKTTTTYMVKSILEGAG